MNISDEWETPEKQPFKDFVSVICCLSPKWPLHILGENATLSLLKKALTNSWRPSLQGNMRHWIEDADCRDQYSVIYEAGERTAIFNNDAKDPITAEERAVRSSSGSREGMLHLTSPKHTW